MNDKYLHSSIEELLADDAFIDWTVKGANRENWESWLKNNPDAQRSIEEARKLVMSISFKEDIIPRGRKEYLWDRIESSTQGKEIYMKPASRRIFWYAASVAAVISFCTILLWPRDSIVYQTNQSLAEMVTLPSASEVRIEPSSLVKYKEKQWDVARNVELEGYAHFKVTKGVPFTVNTENGEVRVLGTEFDVISKGNSFYVKVDEGRVQATTGNYERVLTSDMAIYRNPQWSGEFEIDEQWQVANVQFVFDGQPIQSVIRALTLYYDVKIDASAIQDDIRYSGSFTSSDEVSKSLEAVFWPLNVEFSIKEDQIVLSNR